MTIDPWATNQPTPPRTLTRDDHVLLAARAIFDAVAHDWPHGTDQMMWDDMPDFLRETYVRDAAVALDAAFPLVESAEEIEALGWNAIIINDAGHVYRRDIAPDNRLDHGGKPWSQPGSEGGRRRVGQTSASLALVGPWTVVHQAAA